MLRHRITIINRLGLHARAAAKLVSCTSAFSSKINVGQEGNMVDGKSIMSVMMLAAGNGIFVRVPPLELSGRKQATQDPGELEDLRYVRLPIQQRAIRV